MTSEMRSWRGETRPVFEVGTRVVCERCGVVATVIDEPSFYYGAMANDGGYVQTHSLTPAQGRALSARRRNPQHHVYTGSVCDTRHFKEKT